VTEVDDYKIAKIPASMEDWTSFSHLIKQADTDWETFRSEDRNRGGFFGEYIRSVDSALDNGGSLQITL
jgi:hypothetical protein